MAGKGGFDGGASLFRRGFGGRGRELDRAEGAGGTRAHFATGSVVAGGCFFLISTPRLRGKSLLLGEGQAAADARARAVTGVGAGDIGDGEPVCGGMGEVGW